MDTVDRQGPGATPRGTEPAPVPPQAPAEPAEAAGRLRAAVLRLLPALRGHSAHRDLTPSRLAALAVLDTHAPLRISELAARMDIALSTTSRMADLLDACGWIARRPDPEDQRASLLSLSPAGQTLLHSVRCETTSRLAQEIARLTPDRQRLLYDALPALEDLTERMPSAQQPRTRRTDPGGRQDFPETS
ncbi:MarR family winged helix-turn-helix transcriptional regulator [Streptomyces pinistramenti]|uniref:MarR family winged helix-turn-helix transcriptional regulator n=1 Tax=Streptomyces pinistramenti TaxID=2884812 RepID=UPI001D07ACE7|nr:MarR family transcriptional regulator [Streptomyces pinistramenti]MCB5908871.1 MarR family transcriptional regulator [Streptomyces pinistramenti]